MAAAMKLQMEQLTAMGQQMVQTRDLVGNLQRGDVTLNDTKGLQDSILKMKEDILQSIRSEGEKIEHRIISKINGTSSPAGKRQRKVSINNRQQTASYGTRSEIDADMDMESEASSVFPHSNYTPYARPVQATRKTSFRTNQTVRTNQNGQTYAATVAGVPVGLPEGPRQGQRQQKPPRDQRQHDLLRDQGRPGDNNNNNNRNQSRTTQIKDTYDVINDDITYGHIERKTEWKTVEHKTDGRKRREHKRHLEDVEEVVKEIILHGIPTLIKGVPVGRKSDEARVKKILRELRPGGFEVKNGDVVSSSRQVRNTRKPGFQPITITLKSADLAEDVRTVALEVGILNERRVRAEDREKDNIGYLRRSLTQKERKKIRARAKFFNSERGKALKGIQKREAENTTDQAGWSEVNLEKDDEEEEEIEDISDDAANANELELRARDEAARKAAEAIDSAAQEAAKAHGTIPPFTSNFAKQFTRSTNPMDAQYSNEQLSAQMEHIKAKMAQNEQLERERTALASKDPKTTASGL
jgi:hypothetical protein